VGWAHLSGGEGKRGHTHLDKAIRIQQFSLVLRRQLETVWSEDAKQFGNSHCGRVRGQSGTLLMESLVQTSCDIGNAEIIG
jgi:hypothetical protein